MVAQLVTRGSQEVEETLMLKEAKKQISSSQIEIYLAACDIGVCSKMLEKLPESDHKDILDVEGLYFIAGVLKEKCELLKNESNKLDMLDLRLCS